MFLIVLIIVIFALIALTIALPAISGVGKYNVERPVRRVTVDDADEDTDEYDGYIPPDELQRREQQRQKAKTSAFEKLKNATMDDIPLKFRGDVPEIRKRTAKGTRSKGQFDPYEMYDKKNPDTYDYDIDDIINEELANDRREAEKQPSHYISDPNERLQRLEDLS